MPDTTPLVRTISAQVPALGAAVNGDQVVGEAPFAGTISAATFTPEAAITGDNTNTRTLTIVDKGAAGAGTTIAATLAFTTGNNGVANDEKAFTLGVAANLVVAEGDVIQVNEVIAASGLANPGGLVQVEITRS